MLQKDPSLRCDANTALQNSWITEGGSDLPIHNFQQNLQNFMN